MSKSATFHKRDYAGKLNMGPHNVVKVVRKIGAGQRPKVSDYKFKKTLTINQLLDAIEKFTKTPTKADQKKALQMLGRYVSKPKVANKPKTPSKPKKVVAKPKSKTTTKKPTKSNLLAQIRKGAALKPVAKPKTKSKSSNTVAKALAKRRQAVKGSTSS